ncbi:rab3 GTPase-activating protein non-catalytic subunit isoform X2 [Cephus cinctus]|uniref:Rab3 GTPase-activating protein non-catalytic subunit isoform X2 n=1 Tax=Cephus cinctus TaxID=211228 RepID=A0AAJ7BIB4_CEPCN|nr:rab3 GTPase-activating protein non-catalytic subunit isoform X2 [Cephus cinctus]
MSCQIKGIANLIDPSNVKDRLLGNDVVKFDHVPGHELPLQDILISLSSAGDVLVMAWNKNIVILSSKWDSQETGEIKNKFYVTWNGEIAKEQSEWITSVACLPLISLGKASAGSGPDWTCIAVGFSTGFIRFYAETGPLLVEEQLHSEAVLGIKCQSYSAPRHAGDTSLSEEVYVSYSSAVCILQGFPLFSTLRACRNHLARVQANCNDKPPAANLTYKKWGFKNQDIINDCEVIGTTFVNTFDHLMTASICGGYNATYRSSAPQHSLIMATGKRPFIGFHYALEGGTAPVLSDVAIAMASKLASAIGTAVPWFRGSSKVPNSPEKVKGPVQEPAEAMICRFGLSDIMREGDCIIISPNKMLSVVTDAMGRVTLIDNRRGIALRMWKGYRDAQCGWIEVSEEKNRVSHKGHGKSNFKTSHGHPLRTALFLVIYAPKKGIIDIWGAQQGTKITTFSASKHGRLLYTSYGLLGLNDMVINHTNHAQYPCVFMDPLGGLKEITVPFHFALSSKNGKRARDLHLLKKLKAFMREEEFDEERLINEVANICLDLKTNEVRLQVIEMLMTNKHIVPDALLAALNCFVDKFVQYGDELEPAAKSLYQMSTQLQRATEFYKFVRSQFDCPPEYDTIVSDKIPTAKELSSMLLTSEREVHRILKLSKTLTDFENANPRSQGRVTFKEDGRTFLDFLSCFEFGSSGPVMLHKDLTYEKKCQISELIYQGWMYSNDSVTTWREAAAQSNIQPLTMMQLALIYWLKKKPGTTLQMELKRFTQLLHAVCFLGDVEEICAEYNEISSWWRDARNTLTYSTKPFQALTAAIACRAVAMTIEKNRDKLHYNKVKDDNGNEDEDVKNGNEVQKMEQNQDKKANSTPEEETYSSTSEWENVSKDTCQFTLLIGNLEDIAILNAVVSHPPPSDNTTVFFSIPFEKIDISLGTVLSKGKGSVSEIVAKWLASAGLDPARLIDTTDVEFDHMELSIDSLKMAGSLDEAAASELSQQDQMKLLSVSVEIGSEAKADTTAQAFILEKISLLKRHFPYSLTSSVLLANLCWEFVMAWNKDVTELEALDATLAVLRQIPMKHMRQGVCCLLWTLHMKKRMEAAAKLMNKLGKLPKERLCMQDIGLSDIQLTILLQHCGTFLDIFLDTEVLEAEKSSIVKTEELWEGHPAGPQPFAALAVSQTPACYELVMLHLQLANVLHMIAHFNLKINRPLNNLFESVAHPYFFQDITDKAMLTWYRDDKRDSARTEFLCRVITASMDSIHQETTQGNNLSSTQAILWMSKCQTLASIWKINNDELRIHQVCQLYINGFDRLAEEVVTAVNDTETLASNLLPIAGKRMMAYLSKTPDLLEEVSRIIPALTKYLESLNIPGEVFTNCSNDDTVELVRRVSRHLPENHCDYHLAQLMLDATFIYEGKT